MPQPASGCSGLAAALPNTLMLRADCPATQILSVRAKSSEPPTCQARPAANSRNKRVGALGVEAVLEACAVLLWSMAQVI